MKVILNESFLSWMLEKKDILLLEMPNEEYEMTAKEWADVYVDSKGEAVPFLTSTKDLEAVKYFLETDLYNLSLYLL